MIISQNPTFGTTTRLVAPRIEISWDPETNDGPVEFHLEQLTTKPSPEGWTQTLERFFVRVLPTTITELLGRTYEVESPVTAEVNDESGIALMLGIKAATRAVYDSNVVQADPDADPIAQRIVITWNPINDTGDVTFQVSDRGNDLGVMSASIVVLVQGTYVVPLLDGSGTEELPGWKLMALVKAATEAAIAASLAATS